MKEREVKLIRIKVKQTHYIIQSELTTSTSNPFNANDMTHRTYRLSGTIIDTALTGLRQAIDDHKFNPKSRMETLTNYHEYYTAAINRWDRKKCAISGDLFWIHVFMHIHQLDIPRRSMLRIIKTLFKCNYRGSLIGLEVAQNSKQIDRYLTTIRHSLSIDRKNRRMSIHRIRSPDNTKQS
eukprot:355345_1